MAQFFYDWFFFFGGVSALGLFCIFSYVQNKEEHLNPTESELDHALNSLGVTEKTPSHVLYALLIDIQAIAVSNKNNNLESACERKMKQIQESNIKSNL